MFPYSLVEAKRTYAYPIRVVITITSDNEDDNQDIEIWSGQQQDLFEKYPQRRKRAIEEIRATLARLQQQNPQHQRQPII